MPSVHFGPRFASSRETRPAAHLAKSVKGRVAGCVLTSQPGLALSPQASGKETSKIPVLREFQGRNFFSGLLPEPKT
jgi:hypothetical protein